MCDRLGCMHLPNFKSMDFSRRNFLRATAATTLTMAVGPGLMGAGACREHDQVDPRLRLLQSQHLPGARAADRKGRRASSSQFVNTPTFAEQVTFLGIGQVDVGLMPYTSFVALFDAGAPVKIVAGGGSRAASSSRSRASTAPRS